MEIFRFALVIISYVILAFECYLIGKDKGHKDYKDVFINPERSGESISLSELIDIAEHKRRKSK